MTTVKSSEWSISLAGPGQIVQGLDDIRQCINIILFTRKGTDPLRPRFGVGVFEYIDKPVNVAIPNMRREIIDAINEFEPRVEILKITGSLTESSKVNFNIKYKIANSVLTDQMDINYGLTNT